MQKRHIDLTESDKKELLCLGHQNGIRSKVFKRVTALPELDKGKTIEDVRSVPGVSYPTVASLIKRYKAQGLRCPE